MTGQLQRVPDPPPDIPFIEQHGISPVVFAFISLGIVFVLYQVVGGVATMLLFGLKPDAGMAAGLRLATAAGQILFILAPALVLARLASKSPAAFLRLRRPSLRSLLLPFVGIISLGQMLQIYLVLQERIPLPAPLERFVREFKELFDEITALMVGAASLPELLFVIFVIACVPAVVEEILFRGLVQSSLARSMKPLGGAVLTGVIFGAYHVNPFAFVPLSVLGIYLGFLVMRAGSLWVSVAAHFTNNALAALTMYFHVPDDRIITGNAAELSPVGLTLSFFLLAAVFLGSTYWFVRATRPPAAGGTGDAGDAAAPAAGAAL